MDSHTDPRQPSSTRNAFAIIILFCIAGCGSSNRDDVAIESAPAPLAASPAPHNSVVVQPQQPIPVAKPSNRITSFTLPAPTLSRAQKLSLWATLYYIRSAKEHHGGTPLLDQNNTPLSVPISKQDWCQAGIQGTVRITNRHGQPTTYNYADQRGPQQLECEKVFGWPAKRVKKAPWIKATGRIRYTLAKGQHGDGVNDYQLQPFRTIAVDKKTIPYGSVIYIPAARGQQFQAVDGTSHIHDGYFFAADTGGAIKGQHIDVFHGITQQNAFPSWLKSTATGRFDAYVVQDSALKMKFERQHRGGQ